MALVVKRVTFYPDDTLLVPGNFLYLGYQYYDISPLDKLLKYFKLNITLYSQPKKNTPRSLSRSNDSKALSPLHFKIIGII